MWATTPDLGFSTVGTAPASVLAGESVSVTFTLANNGNGSTNGSVDVGLYLGTTQNVTINDTAIGVTTIGTLASGATGSGSVTGAIPSALNGTYYLGLIADPAAAIPESNENDNLGVVGSILVQPAGGDITITTTSLPNGVVGVPYDHQLTQTGATSPTWTVAGGALPAGLSLTSSGRITGTPLGAETASFTVTAEEPPLMAGTRSLTLTISEEPTGIRLVDAALPRATVGVPYTTQLQATGGIPPYAFQVIIGRPDWLLVDGQGNASGTPDLVGNHALTVSIFDSTGADATVMATLEVVAGGPLALAPSLPDGVMGRAYSAQVISGGVPPYTVNIVNGALPQGFAIDALGMLGGQATAGGTFTFDVGVTDAATPPAQTGGTLTLTIGELQQLVIATTEIGVTIKTDTSEPIVVRGGVPPLPGGDRLRDAAARSVLRSGDLEHRGPHGDGRHDDGDLLRVGLGGRDGDAGGDHPGVLLRHPEQHHPARGLLLRRHGVATRFVVARAAAGRPVLPSQAHVV